MAVVVDIDDLGPPLLDGRPLISVAPSATEQELLAALLALHPNGGTTAQLCRHLWPDTQGEPRRLWPHMSRLRKRLHDSFAERLRIDRTSDSYRIAGDLRWASLEFEAMLAEAHGTDDPDQHVDYLGRAVGIWRGEFLAGFDVDSLVPGRSEALAERWANAAIEYGTELNVRGRSRDALEPGRAVLQRRPFDESAVEVVATALAATGRGIEARRLLHTFRSTLAEELGVEPGLIFRTIEGRIHDVNGWEAVDAPPQGTSTETDGSVPESAGSLDPLHPPMSPTERPPGSLPTWRTTFVGRTDIVELVASRIERERLVTLIGPGGVGKTRAAVASTSLGHNFHRVSFVDLSTISDPEMLDGLVATACGAPLLQGLSARASVIHRLLGARALVILDNCEHLIDAVAALVDEILSATDLPHILTTSRERLRVEGEHVVVVEPLPMESTDGLAPAHALFCDRAGLDPARLHDEDRQFVHRICARLDGLPLALELAAGRVTGLGLRTVAANLNDGLELFTTGSRSGPMRHASLRAALDWSLDLLSSEERTMLERACIFRGSFDLDDAPVLTSGLGLSDVEAKRALADLVDRNLIAHVGGSVSPASLQLLETIREHGREEIARREEDSALQRAHAEHFAAKALALSTDAYGPREVETISTALAQRSDYEAAIDWAIGHCEWEILANVIAGAATTGFFLRGSWLEPVARVADVERLAEPEPMPQRWPTVLSAIAGRYLRVHRTAEGVALAQRVIRLDPENVGGWVAAAYAHTRTNRSKAEMYGRRAAEVGLQGTAGESLRGAHGLAIAVDRPGEDPVASRQLIALAREIGSATVESMGHLRAAQLATRGSPDGVQGARTAIELATAARSVVTRSDATHTLVYHLLSTDKKEAIDVAAACLRTDWVDEESFTRVDMAVAAKCLDAMDEADLSEEILSVVNSAFLPRFKEWPGPGLKMDRPAKYSPTMPIPVVELEALRERAIDRLARGG